MTEAPAHPAVWVVDASYLLKSAPGHIDYARLRSVLARETETTITETHWFNSVKLPISDAAARFNTWIEAPVSTGGFGAVTHLAPTKGLTVNCPECHARFEREVQSSTDVSLVTTVLTTAFERPGATIILTAGDGDFVDAVRYAVDKQGCRVILTVFARSLAPALTGAASESIVLDTLYPRFRR